MKRKLGKEFSAIKKKKKKQDQLLKNVLDHPEFFWCTSRLSAASHLRCYINDCAEKQNMLLHHCTWCFWEKLIKQKSHILMWNTGAPRLRLVVIAAEIATQREGRWFTCHVASKCKVRLLRSVNTKRASSQKGSFCFCSYIDEVLIKKKSLVRQSNWTNETVLYLQHHIWLHFYPRSCWVIRGNKVNTQNVYAWISNIGVKGQGYLLIPHDSLDIKV